MSIYDQRTRAGNLRNPAKALYAHWHSILRNYWTLDSSGRPQGVLQFGQDRNYGIGPFHVYDSVKHPVSEIGTNEYPHLCFGTAYSSVGSTLTLARNGEFRLQGFRGDESRNRLARNSFLDWNRTASRPQWFVNPGDLTSKWNNNLLTAWRNPVHYVEESLLTPGWRTHPFWVKLQRDRNVVGGWKIVFSRMSETERPTYVNDVDVAARFERYEELRLKRLRHRREEELLASGELVLKGGRVRSSAEIEQRKDELALVIAAHLDVRMPAKTTPLKRTSEEEVDNGNDNLAPLDPHGAEALAPG